LRLVRGQRLEEGQLTAFLVIGDGHHDESVLEALLKRFESREQKKALLMPQDRPALGLAGSLDLAAYLIRRFGKDVLVVIDREHFSRNFYQLLGEVLRKHQLGQYTIRRRRTRGFREVEVRRDEEIVKLYVAVMGFERRVEEAEAVLIREFFGVEVEPEKGVIRSFLKEKGMSVEDLIMRAGEAKLKKAFPSAFVNLLKKWGRVPSLSWA